MLIGIGGVSRAGKSTLADQLLRQAAVQGKRTYVLHQDVFVHDKERLPRVRDRIDWEHPDSIDWFRLREAILQAQVGNQVVVVEGLFAFHHSTVNTLYDKAVFLHIPRPVFQTRKAIDLRWGPEPEWYLDHIWDSYQEFGQPADDLSPIIHLSGEVMVEATILEALLR